jgi:hypothetical protein
MNFRRPATIADKQVELRQEVNMVAHCRRRLGRSASRVGNPLRRCAGCEQHRARFVYRGRVRADRKHDLCMRCYRSVLAAYRAYILRSRARTVRYLEAS